MADDRPDSPNDEDVNDIRPAWNLPGSTNLFQSYNRRSKRVIFGAIAVAAILIINGIFARKHGRAIYSRIPGSKQLIGSLSNSQHRGFEETIRAIWEPIKLPITAKNFTDQDGVTWEMPLDPIWTEPLGKRLLIIDSDNHPLSEKGEIMYPYKQLWKDMNPLSIGMLSHYMYAMIHGYDYHLYRSPKHPDRNAAWAKITMTIEALKSGYDYVLYMDSDAQMTNPSVPLEWFFNRWNLTKHDPFSIGQEPDLDRDKDKFGKRGVNTGFFLVKNDPRAFAILQAWAECPERYPGCEALRDRGLHEQAAFCDYVRYDTVFRSLIKILPCNEVNGYPGAFKETKCGGAFVRHVWKDKAQTKDWFAHAVLHAFAPQLHLEFVSRQEEVVVDYRDKTLKGALMLDV